MQLSPAGHLLFPFGGDTRSGWVILPLMSIFARDTIGPLPPPDIPLDITPHTFWSRSMPAPAMLAYPELVIFAAGNADPSICWSTFGFISSLSRSLPGSRTMCWLLSVTHTQY